MLAIFSSVMHSSGPRDVTGRKAGRRATVSSPFTTSRPLPYFIRIIMPAEHQRGANGGNNKINNSSTSTPSDAAADNNNEYLSSVSSQDDRAQS